MHGVVIITQKMHGGLLLYISSLIYWNRNTVFAKAPQLDTGFIAQILFLPYYMV